MEASGKFVYKQEKAPPIVSLILLERGWEEFNSAQHSPHSWSLLWKTCRAKPSEYSTGLTYQRINHFPKTSLLCTKDNLARRLRTMRAIHGTVFHYAPQTFILPNEYSKFVQECVKKEGLWICKPADLSRGRKIFLFRDIRELKYDQQVIVQRYMKSPLLIGQHKWDMRVYVLVTCYHPLTVYLYKEGLARFSSTKYDLSDLNNKYSHLTNSSINKFSPSHGVEKEVIGSGCKWTFQQLNCHLANMGVDVVDLWTEIRKIAVLTLLSIASEVPE